MSAPSTLSGLPPSGFPPVSELPWGTHLCHFYRTPEDLASTLVPYFTAGLAHNERCLWITSPPLPAREAWEALCSSVPEAERHARQGRIDILDHEEWYSRTGRLGPDAVLSSWLEREEQALRDGFSGLRLSGHTFWLERADWDSFRHYESRFHEACHARRIVALCSYRLDRCSGQDILDVLHNHGFALVRREGSWELTDMATRLLATVGDEDPTAAPVATPALHRASAHGLQLIAGETFPADCVAEFLCEGLRTGEPAVAVATAPHLAQILAECERAGVSVGPAVAAGQLLTLEAEATLASFLRAGRPEPALFRELVAAPLTRLTADERPARFYGEMVDLLWRRGLHEAALALEDLWNDLLARLPVRLLCGYSLGDFDGEMDVQGFRRLCARHGQVRPAEDLDRGAPQDAGRLRAELQIRTRHLNREEKRRHEAENTEREAKRQLEAAHERLARLQTVTSALSEAVTVEDIGRVVVVEMARVVRAEQAIVALPQGEDLYLLAHDGLPPEAPAAYATFSIDAELPAAESYRTGLPVWISTPAELKQRYPGLPPTATAALGCMPIGVAGRLLGVVGFGFLKERSFSAMDRALMQDLARQVGLALERARLYEAARRGEAQLYEANRRKDEFLALLGHELRNPLAPIMTALHLMKLRGDAASERERGMIERQVRHVSRLVDDLLDVSRITQGKLELRKTPVELSAVMAQAVELASPLIEQRSHQLTVDLPGAGIWVDADPVRLAQAVANLLNNAAKYTDYAGRITVTVRRDASHVVIAVRDTGMGIRPEMLSRIFAPFVQSERTIERAQGGLGLGLALVKSLVELHGGSVSASSDGVGRGSEFRIRVPALAAPASAEGLPSFVPKRRRVDPAAARRVLIVDDNPDAAEGLATMLNLVGHEAQVAHDGPEALDKAGQVSFDVFVLDINLPMMDGYELARRLRERAGSPAPRFVALTGFGTDDDRTYSLEQGFVAHLVKPIDHEQLLKLLETA